MIIHICGASGSGKTTLGNKIVTAFGENVVVVDMDLLRERHLQENAKKNITFEKFVKTYEPTYQKYIDDFIASVKKKPIVFVGLNVYINNETFNFKNKTGTYPKVFFDLHADYNFYIHLPTSTIVRRLFDRDFPNHMKGFSEWAIKRKNIIYSNLLKNEKTAQNDLSIAMLRPTNIHQMKTNVQNWNRFYKNKKYVFLSAKAIYSSVSKLLHY